MQSILSPRRLRMVIRMSSTREFLHVGRHRRSFARHGFIFTFHASLRRFIEFQNFVSPTYVDLRRDASSKSGRIRGRWMRSWIWFFVIHLRGWKYSCIHDGYRVNPSNPFDRFLGLSTPWMQIHFVVGLFEACSRHFITLFLTFYIFLHIFVHVSLWYISTYEIKWANVGNGREINLFRMKKSV